MNRALFAGLILFSLPALAHEGHGSSNAMSVWHYLIEPEHALPALLAVASVGAWRWLRGRGRRRKLD